MGHRRSNASISPSDQALMGLVFGRLMLSEGSCASHSERSLRGQMCLWSGQQIDNALSACGFEAENVTEFWRSYLFVGKVAVKRWKPQPTVVIQPQPEEESCDETGKPHEERSHDQTS